MKLYKKLYLGSILLLSINAVFAHEDMLIKNLTVNGIGSENIPAKLANPNLAIEVNTLTAKQAQQEAAKISSIVAAYLRSQKVDKLKTTNINLYPRYDYENNKQKLIGYTANNSISFQVDSEKAGVILDEAVRLGASRIDGISFSASNEEIEIAKNKAIQKAVLDAKQKSEAVFNVLGLRAKEIINIKIDNASSPPIVMRTAASFKAADTPIISGETSIDASVTLQISY